MRHKFHHRKLNRTMEHRKALRRNMAQSLFQHGLIETTLPKAKDLRPFAEKLITLAVNVRKHAAADDAAASLRARRQIQRLLGDRSIIAAERQEAYDAMSDAARRKTLRMASGRRYRTGEAKGRLEFTGESVVHRLIESVAPNYEDRPGGYTRIIRLAKRRVGDHSQLAILQLVGEEEAPGSLAKPEKTARQRRADARYAMAIKAAKAWKGGDEPEPQQPEPAAEDDAEEEATTAEVPAAEAPAEEPAAETPAEDAADDDEKKSDA